MKIKVAATSLFALLCIAMGSSPSQAQSDQSIPPRRQGVQTVSGPIVIEPTRSTQAGWKTYEFKYGKGKTLSLILPKEPKVETEQFNVEAGIDVISHIITADSDSTVFVAGYIELVATNPSVKLTLEMRRQLSSMFWKLLAEGMQEALTEKGLEAKLTASEQKSVMVSGHEGQEQDFLIGKMAGRYRAVIGERNIYVVMAFSALSDNAMERDAVIQSFRISPAN